LDPNEQAAFSQAIKHHDELRAFLPKFAERRALLRPPDRLSYKIREWIPAGTPVLKGAARDFAVCALVNKGCNSHAAVRVLADTGNGDDAMVLTRVVMELAVVLQWMLLDPVYRLDLYCLSSDLSKRHWIELSRQYFPRELDLIDQMERSLSRDDRAVVDAAFGQSKYKWARERQPGGKFKDFSLDDMLAEIAAIDGSATSDGFIYDVTYHMHSAHAHGGIDAMRQFKTLRNQKTFTCELGYNEDQSVLAVRGANIYCCWLLQGACKYLGFSELDRDLDEWFARMTSTMKGGSPPGAAQ
jgi:hypothetical protein